MLDFSYEEQWTGTYDQTDPDGPKKIYVKTIDCGKLVTGGKKNTPTGIENIKECLEIRGRLVLPSSYTAALPHINGNLNGSHNVSILWLVKENAIMINIDIDAWLNTFARVTIYYTKNE
ncbi:hypothetical protein C4J81_03485 [Deltaproteobacteria bacterium Smac51]|nr:hypothetical protein C4J81_03485 [Deltaproteobacteria bacterium Smac51]